MPAGKAIVSGGVAPATRLHFGVNVCSMRRYAKRGVAALTVAELKQCRRDLRFAFKIYQIDCASGADRDREAKGAHQDQDRRSAIRRQRGAPCRVGAFNGARYARLRCPKVSLQAIGDERLFGAWVEEKPASLADRPRKRR
jgi:hypothetical protein